MKPTKFFVELKRRKVYSVAVTYAVIGWVLIQVATQVFPAFEIPNWSQRLVILGIVVGFPITLALAWVYDFTRHGIMRTSELDVTKGDRKIHIVEAPAVPAGTAEKSIAVLPFLSMSSDPENEYLSDGLTEDLIMAFSQLKGLRVPARTSSFAFKGRHEDIRSIGQQLNVNTILEGSVRKVGNRLRITAQLINVTGGDHLWSQTFDREMQEVFAIQDEITRAIVHALEMQLIGAGDQPLATHGTYNTDAYQLYLQGRYHFYKFTSEGFRRCIECCNKALQIEPSYALAYAALSLCYQTGWFYGHLSFEEKVAAIGREDQAAEKAVELDPNLAETQTALAMVRFWNERDWPRAEDCFKQAIKLNPNYVTAHEHYAAFLMCRRRTDRAITHARLAQQLDPLSLMINLHTGLIYLFMHREDLVLTQAHTLFDLEPNFFGVHWLFG